jgi:hypothetical protein
MISRGLTGHILLLWRKSDSISVHEVTAPVAPLPNSCDLAIFVFDKGSGYVASLILHFTFLVS